jgi:hypothetical protein
LEDKFAINERNFGGTDMTGKMQKLCAAVIVATGLAAGRMATADITITDDPTGIQNPATGEYQYDVEVDPGSSTTEITAGDGFVLYDWPGLITTGPDAPTLTGLPFGISNLNIQQSLLGNYLNSPPGPSDSNTTPYTPNKVDNNLAFLGTTDAPNIENISFVYNGSGVANVANPTVGVLTLWSSFNGASATDNPNGANVSMDSSGAGEAMSYVGSNNTVPVPEPTTLSAVFGGAALLLSRRRSRSKASA